MSAIAIGPLGKSGGNAAAGRNRYFARASEASLAAANRRLEPSGMNLSFMF
jgi:hypothetical protein